MSSPTSIRACLLGLLPLSQAAALSLPSTSLINERAALLEGKAQAHNLASLDISNGVPAGPIHWFNASDPPDMELEPRRMIDYCISDVTQAGVCVGVAGVVVQIGTAIGTAIKNRSKAHDCSAVSGKIDNVTWRSHAEGGCHVKSELGTIEGAIDNYLRDVDKDVCGTHCIRMTHGGKWTAYVELAPAGTDLNSYYCGPAYHFGQCGSGGKKDRHG